jgi:hypothetical protein
MREPPRQQPSPFGHDPDFPPWRVIDYGEPQLLRDAPADKQTVAVRRTFHNTSMPEAPRLQLTVTETLADPGDAAARTAAEERLLHLIRMQLYYRMFDPREMDVPRLGVKFLDEQEGIRPPAEEDTRLPFEGILDLEEKLAEKVERVTVLTLELLADPPREDDPPLAVGVTIDPPIGLNQLHGYVAKCTKSAYASVRALAGSVRLRVTRNGVSLGAVEDKAGGSASPSVGASTPTKATYDAAVRGLAAGSDYRISLGWVRGSGGGC